MMLKGNKVYLRVVEQEDFSLLVKWFNDPQVLGKYNPILQSSRYNMEKLWESNLSTESQRFIIEKKDGTEIGFMNYFTVTWDGVGKLMPIAYFMVPNARGKGYCTEASKIIVDYLFLSREIPCIQATTHRKNIASQKVLEKIGFKKEGIMRKRFYIRGVWEDQILYSILRREWKKPKILINNS